MCTRTSIIPVNPTPSMRTMEAPLLLDGELENVLSSPTMPLRIFPLYRPTSLLKQPISPYYSPEDIRDITRPQTLDTATLSQAAATIALHSRSVSDSSIYHRPYHPVVLDLSSPGSAQYGSPWLTNAQSSRFSYTAAVPRDVPVYSTVSPSLEHSEDVLSVGRRRTALREPAIRHEEDMGIRLKGGPPGVELGDDGPGIAEFPEAEETDVTLPPPYSSIVNASGAR